MLKAKTIPVLELAIEEGVAYGYRRAFKHCSNPSEQQIIDEITKSVLQSTFQWFDADE